MDENTPVLALAGISSLFIVLVAGSSVIESGTGRRVPLLARLGIRQAPQSSRWSAMIALAIIGVPIGILQVAMVAAVIGPDRAPLTRTVGALELVGLAIWVLQMFQHVRGRTRGRS